MDAINKYIRKPGEILIDGHVVPVKEKKINGANIIKVRVGTNGIQGGDSGHGSRTHFSIENHSGTCMAVSCQSNPGSDGRVTIGDMVVSGLNGMSVAEVEAEYFEVEFAGDSELDTFIEALEFAVATLKEQRGY